MAYKNVWVFENYEFLYLFEADNKSITEIRLFYTVFEDCTIFHTDWRIMHFLKKKNIPLSAGGRTPFAICKTYRRARQTAVCNNSIYIYCIIGTFNYYIL